MKRLFFAAGIAANILAQQNVMPTPPPTSDVTMAPNLDRRTTYTWFNDPDFVSPNGEISTVNAELTRLRSAYSGYTFSATSGTGLSPFEWGYNPNYTTAVIYSNY